mgnify:CR=1 FL=1
MRPGRRAYQPNKDDGRFAYPARYEGVASRDYADILTKVDGLAEAIGSLAGESEAARAAAIEFMLEGLHLHKLLNKYSVDGRASYMG